MNLTKKQFDILVLLEGKNSTVSQREIAQETGISVGSVNKTMGELCELSFVADGKITDAGISALEPYRVKRAVFMAAGFGSRLVPITLNTPKPLVRVKGKRIIDSLLDAVIAAGIEEIYLVRGYLSEQFDQLLKKYPQIVFIENPVYNETDLLLYHPKIITKYQYSSSYLGVYTERAEDWCFEADSNGVIKKLGIGGTDCYHMFGISYWTKEDGEKLDAHLSHVYNEVPGGKQRYWDQVMFDYHLNDYKITVRPCSFSDIVEIDTFNELKAIDSNYAM